MAPYNLIIDTCDDRVHNAFTEFVCKNVCTPVLINELHINFFK